MAASIIESQAGEMERGQWRAPWWLQPLAVFTILSAFVVYATFRVFEGSIWAEGHYVATVNGVGWYHSPFGSPDLRFLLPGFVAALVPFPITPALLILPFPAGFRFTCYYYRKAYYRAFAWTPPACAVPAVGSKSEGGKRKYTGENGILVFQNLHRFFLYFAILIVGLLAFDAAISVWQPGHGFHFGVGSAILWLNVVLLAGYTFGCHALRHLIGGNMDCFSCGAWTKTKYKWWRGVSWLNQRHALWAWLSLISVVVSDVYIRWASISGATTFLGVPV